MISRILKHISAEASNEGEVRSDGDVSGDASEANIALAGGPVMKKSFEGSLAGEWEIGFSEQLCA